MKTTLFLLFILLAGCSKDNSGDPTFTLPPETQIGANTFGVTINGKVYVPRDPIGFNIGGETPRGVIFWTSPDGITWDELTIVDGASSLGFKMIIHIQNLKTIKEAKYILNESNFQDQSDSNPNTNIYFFIYNSNLKEYCYYGSIQNLGELNITRYDSLNRIVSGNFKGKFIRYGTSDDTITINDGRFDINWNTVFNHSFP